MTANSLFSLVPETLILAIKRWRNTRLEQRYLRCAEIEKQKADECLQNVRYFQTKAAIARSNRI